MKEVSNNKITYKQVISVFEACFFESFNTLLEAGHSEPLYIPAQKNSSKEKNQPAKICFREDFVSSALHEVAHWCIAGEERRQKVDFGYWYEPDGRDASQQKLFQQLEVKPQALEWLFSIAAGVAFNISLDNLEGEAEIEAETESYEDFYCAVKNQARSYLETGMPECAEIFLQGLSVKSGIRLPAIEDLLTAENPSLK